MSVIAASATIIVLLVGLITVLREGGYSFDLRAKSNKNPGGRRANDQA